MNIQKAYNFKYINDLVSSSGHLIQIDLQSLVSERYESVINLLPDDDDHATDDEKAVIEGLGIHYVHIPVDWNNPKTTDFAAFETAMKHCKSQKTHIHCAANYRASAFYALYAYRNLSWSSGRSHAFISEVWTLSKYPVWEVFVNNYLNP